jgi:hypothetical protein
MLQQLISAADLERRKLASTANLNMPLKQSEKLDRGPTTQSSHSRAITFSYSEEETSKAGSAEDPVVKQLKEEIS